EHLVESLRLVRSRRVDEARPPPLAGVAVEGELRHHEQRSPDILERAIHLPFVVTEEAEPDDLVRHPLHLLRTVAVRESHEEAEAAPHLPNDLPVYPHFGARYALEQDPHETGRKWRRRVE